MYTSSEQLITIDIDTVIARVNGIKATVSVYADSIAADIAMNAYIARLEELKLYTDYGTLEVESDTLILIAEHERDAAEIEIAKAIGQFKYASDTLQGIAGAFCDMTSNLPALESLSAYNDMLDEEDRVTRSDYSFEYDRHAS